MMSSKSDPILSRDQLNKRNSAMLAPDTFTKNELIDLGVEDDVRGRKFDPDTYLVDTEPVDQATSSRKVDRRKIKPEVGD